jgi:hypothetical protein
VCVGTCTRILCPSGRGIVVGGVSLCGNGSIRAQVGSRANADKGDRNDKNGSVVASTSSLAGCTQESYLVAEERDIDVM